MNFSPSLSLEVKQISLASSLYDGIEDNDLSQIKYLLNTKDVNLNFVIPGKGISVMHFIAGSQPSEFAVEVVRLFLLHGGDPNARSSEGMTPCHVAAAWGQVELLKLLLASGGDPDLYDDDGLTCMDYALRENHEQVVELLTNFASPPPQEIPHDKINDVSLQLEKLVMEDDNNLITEISVNNVDLCTDCKETTKLHKDNLANLDQSAGDDSWHRVAQWCEEQSQLVSPSIKQERQSEISVPPHAEYHVCSDSEDFFTCQSRRQTVSSHMSSAVSALYRYTDKQHGVVLIEKRMPGCSVTSVTELSETEADVLSSQRKTQTLTSEQGTASLGSVVTDLGYCTEALKRELLSRGYPIGPITTSTKKVYLRRLALLRRGQPILQPVSPGTKRFSRELERTLRDLTPLDLVAGSQLEQKMAEQFLHPPPGRLWREGLTKCSFTYLLLDPRISCNLPVRAISMSSIEIWKTFLNAIFYVGKGKRSRPYSHLYHAVDVWNHKSNKTDDKTESILAIWRAGLGVVCLHVFQSIIPVEAYTREAAMIDALGLENVCNLKRGEYYGHMVCKPPDQRRLLGVYLLNRAMHVLLHEGERQLQPLDIAL